MAPESNKPTVKKKKQRSIRKKVFAWSIVAALLAVICGLAAYMFVVVNGQRQLDANMNKTEMDQASILYDSSNKEVTKLMVVNRELVDFKDIPPKVRNAFVATEDKRFYQHKGVDFWSIGRALAKDVIARSAAEGASTITQQLARNMFLNADKTFFRKANEVSFAMALENRFSKDQILEMYLNRIFFGNNAWGIKAAAKTYFGVSDLNQLQTWQIATLAAMPKGPSVYNPIKNPEKSKERRAVILQLMTEQGLISEAEKEQAKAVDYTPPTQAEKKDYLTYIDYVVNEAVEKYHIDEDKLKRGGYKVYSSMNAEAQRIAEQSFTNDALFQKDLPDQQMQGAMVIQNNKDGGIVAMIGGRDYETKGLNRAILPQQPGSAMKPLVAYAPALESGKFNPYSMLKDEQTNFNGYQPKNYDSNYRGQVTMIEAVKKSINLPAVWTFNEVGVKKGMDFAASLGLTFDAKDRNLAIALGGLTNGESPLQMAQAYSAFANNGELNTAHAIVKITDTDGKTVAEFKEKAKQVMNAKTAWNMTQMLQTVMEPDGTGARGKMNRPVAGKTGTTQLDGNKNAGKTRDIWFVGYTPEWTGAVWMGFDKPSAVTIGSGSAAMLFKDVMQKALAKVPVTDFKKPNNVPDLTAPPKGVSGFTAVYDPTARRVKLNWSPVDPNMTYQIHRKDVQSEFALLTELKGAGEVSDIEVTPGQTYQYFLVPMDPNTGQPGQKSAVVTVEVPAGASPSPGTSASPSVSPSGSPDPNQGPVVIPFSPGPGGSPSPQPTPTNGGDQAKPTATPKASASPAAGKSSPVIGQPAATVKP